MTRCQPQSPPFNSGPTGCCTFRGFGQMCNDMHPPGLRGTLNSVTSVLREERGDGDVRSGRDGREDTTSRGCWSSPESGGSLEGTPSEPPEGGSPVHTLPSCSGLQAMRESSPVVSSLSLCGHLSQQLQYPQTENVQVTCGCMGSL